jgi:hypothetical protein
MKRNELTSEESATREDNVGIAAVSEPGEASLAL